ncbi:tripartite tricarboxylate transporter substrate-binding protein [Methylopila sp. M107]|uniref:tripartite tricarboxylate transporter substrate-binding protein n=1 Tax=Methylopila sp. M107 TaxID=1101190 RepID=UPI000362F28F|nr:tripartite tricarboxylate transporter substrate-binding protein [Methylopila sp. M107]
MSRPSGLAPTRRRVAAGLAAGLSAAAIGRPAFAQIAGLEVVAPGAPGDGQDQLARAIAEGLALTKLTPRAMAVTEPREVDAVSDFAGGKRSRAALMVVGLSTLGVLNRAGAAGRIDDLRPLARILGEHLPLVVPAGSKIKSVARLMDQIRADASAVTWSGRPLGSADHMLCLQVTKAAGGDLSRVAYRPFATSAEASNVALKGEVMVGVGALTEFMQQIRGGTLTALAVASPERVPDLDAPTLRELGVDVAQLNWRGVVTRESVGRALIDRYADAVGRVVRTPGWGELMKARHWVDMYQQGPEFGRFLTEERRRVAALMSAAGTR